MNTLTNQQREKRYQFVKLCSALTRQGFQFYREPRELYALTFPLYDAKRLRHPETRLPFVNALCRISGDKNRDCYQFDQWAGRW